jgi:hypothetical protein
MARTKITSPQFQNATLTGGVNAGTGGGSMNYMSIGNIRICWGTSAVRAVGGGTFVTSTFIYPFTFATIPTFTCMTRENVTSATIFAYQEQGTPSTTGTNVTLYNSGAAGSAKIDWIAMGVVT